MARTVTRKMVEQSARSYLERVAVLGQNSQAVSQAAWNRALRETMRAEEKAIRLKGGRVVD